MSLDPIITTWKGNRGRQHEEFRAMPFREKLSIIEQMGEVTEFFWARRKACRERQSSEKPESAERARDS